MTQPVTLASGPQQEAIGDDCSRQGTGSQGGPLTNTQDEERVNLARTWGRVCLKRRKCVRCLFSSNYVLFLHPQLSWLPLTTTPCQEAALSDSQMRAIMKEDRLLTHGNTGLLGRAPKPRFFPPHVTAFGSTIQLHRKCGPKPVNWLLCLRGWPPHFGKG